MANGSDLQVEDISFDGPLGSSGATARKLDRDVFEITLSHLPNRPDWSTRFQLTLLRHARGHAPCFKVRFGGAAPGRKFNNFFSSWSYDLVHWTPVHWQKGWQNTPGTTVEDTVYLPPLDQDHATIAHMVPLSFEQHRRMADTWAGHPGVTVGAIGQSIEGRDLLWTTLQSTRPGKARYRHFFSCQHGEQAAQWRMIGMVEWLLGEEAKSFRRDHECHFVVMMNPDAPSNGWLTTNAEGIDMQWFHRKEADNEQAHESRLCQQHLERLMKEGRFMTSWSMHAWAGPVEPMVLPAGRMTTAWLSMREALLRHDRSGLCKPLIPAEVKAGHVYTSWGHGPWQTYGVTSFPCEGGGSLTTAAANMASGQCLIKALADAVLETHHT